MPVDVLVWSSLTLSYISLMSVFLQKYFIVVSSLEKQILMIWSSDLFLPTFLCQNQSSSSEYD